jgi:membrane dipeptidase
MPRLFHKEAAVHRRELLKGMAAGAALPLLPELQSADADLLYDRSIVIDTLAFENWDGPGFAAAKQTGYTGIQTSLANRTMEAITRDLATWQERLQQHPDKLMHATKAADIERAKREGKLAIVLGTQNATCIESRVGNLDRLYEMGLRCIQLTYNARNLLGDGCTERTNAGLSDFGVEVVARMNELGMIVDLSHCGQQTSADGIEFSKKPPAFTHTMCKAIYDHPRAKSDELLKAMADKGGVTGILTLGYFLGPDPVSVVNYVNHVDHAVKVAGIDHVGMATDYQLRGIEASATRETWYVPRLRIFKPSYKVRWPSWAPDLDKPDRFRVAVREMSRRGYKTGDIEKLLGLNWLRYFREIFGG